MSWFRRAKLGITSFRNLTNSTTQIYGKTTIPTCCKPPTTSFQRSYLSGFQRRLAVSAMVVVSGVMVAKLYYFGVRIENVPYTNRWHSVWWSPMKEKPIGDRALRCQKLKYEGKFLDEKHPQSVRAKLILKNIIQGLEREVKRNPNSNASGFNHYDQFNWHILVVDELGIGAFCIPGGNIFIWRGALEAFTDAELAMVIGHEVGHVVARHLAEPPKMFVDYTRKRELEADYIGLLLMASAGYDPRIAPELWRKVSPDEVSNHIYPSFEERAILLAQAHVMEQALTIYEEIRPRCPVHVATHCCSTCGGSIQEID